MPERRPPPGPADQGRAAPRDTPALPLAGLRVLAVEQYGAGPFGTLFLADLGAEVIKIENPREGGDIARDVGPFFFAEHDSLFFHSFNRNKRSITLDLHHPEARVVLHDLVAGADALCSNLRGDVPARLGLTYEHLREANPALVCAHLSAYGRDGPRAAWPGFDYLMQAETGYLSLTGEPCGPPARFGLSVVDFMTGLALAYATLAGVLAARAGGRGRDLDVSLFDVALFNTSYLATWYLNQGHVQQRLARSAHPSLVPCQLYRTADGWLFIMCNKEKFWPALCEAIGRSEWIEDPRLRSFRERLAERERLTDLIDEALCVATTAEWLERFAGRVPAAPVNDLAAALESPFVTEHGRIQRLTHPEHGRYRMLAPPVRVAGTEPPARPAPALGADTEELLRGLGYPEERIAALRAAGVV